MILIIHIILSLISIVQATYTIFSPTKAKLQVGYLLTSGVIASGLIVSMVNNISIRQVCARGAIYLGLIVTMFVLAQKRIYIKTQLDFRGQREF